MNYDVKCQLLIIGNSNVGKTSIITRFTNGTFSQNYLATVGVDNYTKIETIDNKNVQIKLWDTAGQEKFKSLTKSFFRGAEGVILVYDITNLESFTDLKLWINSIKENLGEEKESIPSIIVGNKIDLGEREISLEEANKFCKDNNYEYFETSAKTGENIDKSFRALVKKILAAKSDDDDGDKQQEGNIKINSKDQKPKEGGCGC
jgi:small GTP-binding protein